MQRDADIKQSLGSAIRQSRLDAGLTQEEVAFAAGISTTYLSDVERGKRNVSVINLVRIAEALSITTAELIAHAKL